MKPISKFAVRNHSADLKYIELLDHNDSDGVVKFIGINRYLIPTAFFEELAATCSERVDPFGTLCKPSDLCGEQYYAELDKEQRHVMGLILGVLAYLGRTPSAPPLTDHLGRDLSFPEVSCCLEDIPTVGLKEVPVASPLRLH